MPAKIIMYVDDDEDDREFLSIALRNVNEDSEIIQAQNGLEAIEYLNQAKTNRKPLPCVIVLDLNMPLLDGRQTYDKLKTDPTLQKLPVVVLTTSQNPEDRIYFNNLGVNFITKPHNISYLDDIARHILNYCN